MKYILTALLLSISLIQISPLHLSQHHQGYSQYLSTLKSSQNSITTSLQQLQQDISTTQQSITQQTNLTLKIQKLQQAIARQKRLVSEMSLSAVTPLSDISVVCPNLNETTQSQLAAIAGGLAQTTEQLKNSVQALDPSQSSPELTTDSQLADNYADQISQTLKQDTTYKKPTQFQPIYLTNLAADNWSKGPLSIDQINQNYTQLSNSADNVKYCPLETPFYDGKQCINCQENKYFDLSISQCIQCQNFNKELHACEEEVVVVRPNTTNFEAASKRLILPPGETLANIQSNVSESAVSCPADKPFYVDNSCIDCVSPDTLFNYTTKSCTHCPANSIYEPNQARCLAQPKYTTNYVASPNSVIVPQGTTLDQILAKQKQQSQTNNLESCPTSTPFYNGKQCIACTDPNLIYFDIQSKKCVSCPQNTVYNKAVHQCLKQKYYSNLANTNWTSTNPASVKQLNRNQSSDPSYIQCPIQKPFYDGSACIGCGMDEYFSFDGLSCSKCAPSTIFSITLHQCVTPTYSSQTNPLTAPNLIYGGISKNQWSTKYYKNLEQNPNIADCPPQHPYYDGSVCVKCPDSHPYFNLRYNMCQSCEDQSSYDEKAHECLSTSGGILDQTPNLEKMAAGIFS